MQDQATKRLEEKDRLYERYGKPFEDEHKGEYLAISNDGSTILGEWPGEVLHQAIEEFGRSNFRVGHRVFAQWLLLAA